MGALSEIYKHPLEEKFPSPKPKQTRKTNDINVTEDN